MSNVQPSLGKDRDQVVSLHDLTCINGRSQNEHLYDLNEWPEEHVAALIKEQCLERPDLLHLKLPSSLLKLDLSYCTTIRDEDVAQVIKQCIQLTSIILNGNELLTNGILAHVLRLPHLDRLCLANLRRITSVTHEAREINVREGRACPLRVLEVENCSMDDSWMEALTHLPYLEHFKSVGACDPQEGFLAITMPANLRSVEITLSQKAQCVARQRELFLFFLHNPSAETLQRFIYNPSKGITVDSKPDLFAAVNLRTLETNANVIMSRDFLHTLSTVCRHLNSFCDPIGGKGMMGHWELERNKLLMKLDYHSGYLFKAPAANDDIWNTNPKIVSARSMHPNQPLGLPMQQIASVESLDLTNVVIQDIGLLLSQLPNLKHLTLNQITMRNPGLGVETTFSLPLLETLHLESRVDLPIIWAISSRATNLKKVTLAPALVKEFQKPNTVWISVLLEAFPRVEKLILTTLAWSRAPNKQFKVELGVLNTDRARNLPLKFLMLRKTKVRRQYTPDDPYLDCEFNFVSKTNFELLPNLLYLEMNNVRINEDIVLGGPNMKMLWIEGPLALGPAARLGFPSRILKLGWRVKSHGTDICKLLPSMKYLQSIHIVPEAKNQWHTNLELSQADVKSRTGAAVELDKDAPKVYAQQAAVVSKPLIDPNYRYHAYTETEINDLREMFSIHQISTKKNEETVTLGLKLANGPSLVILCNPTHRVMDLYGYVRHEMKIDIGFDLVKVPDMILDVKTFKKTIGELHLQNSSLHQVLRNYDSVEYQLKLSTVFLSLPSIPRTAGRLQNHNLSSNMNVAVVANNINEITLGSLHGKKRKNDEDVAQLDPRQTKKAKCSKKSSVHFSEVKPSPMNSMYFTSEYQYYADLIERYEAVVKRNL
eukprot:TRINITY_DN1902_c0_g1_i1.p1 TRINITY_DN1902_c0_g1~~TRINITY_DN1902_c0_g1_i1.p1  ORF type:complete len:884 (+),score=38.50 TRINITY_DN1902_c0_g1_i1:75-2726(+)